MKRDRYIRCCCWASDSDGQVTNYRWVFIWVHRRINLTDDVPYFCGNLEVLIHVNRTSHNDAQVKIIHPLGSDDQADPRDQMLVRAVERGLYE